MVDEKMNFELKDEELEQVSGGLPDNLTLEQKLEMLEYYQKKGCDNIVELRTYNELRSDSDIRSYYTRIEKEEQTKRLLQERYPMPDYDELGRYDPNKR